MSLTLNMELKNSKSFSENIISLGKSCLNIRKGVGQKKQVKLTPVVADKPVDSLIGENNYKAMFWEETRSIELVPDFVFEDSLPCAYEDVSSLVSGFTYMGALERVHAKKMAGNIKKLIKNIAPKIGVFGAHPGILKARSIFIKSQKFDKLPIRQYFRGSFIRDLAIRVQAGNRGVDPKFGHTLACIGLIRKSRKRKAVFANLELKHSRYRMYYDAIVSKEYFRALRRLKAFPTYEYAKRSTMFAHIHKTKRKTIAKANIGEQSERHPTGQFQALKKYLTATINVERFEKWEYKTTSVMSYTNFYKTVWRYFKLKLERFFYKKLGVRMHIWFMNIWDIFMTGVDSYWRWFKFEDQKIFAMTRKGQRYMIEDREEAKFYLRSMALTLTFGGGVKLFINKVTEMLRQYRNNWAFITYTMESLRLCGNFFWFRFFLNYKITLQGKIGGILRAAKKTFKKGDVTVEDRSAVVLHHRTFPQSKFGTYCLGFWMQYRVPNLIGTFDELEYIDTMKVLLSMYTIPWLSTRLTEIIEAILREQEIKKQIKFSQYNRRVRARGILASEFRTFIKRNKFKAKKVLKKLKKLKNNAGKRGNRA